MEKDIAEEYVNNNDVKKFMYSAGTFPFALGVNMIYYNIIAKVPDFHWWWAHFSGGAVIGSLLYSGFQKKMSKGWAALSTLITIGSVSVAWELFEEFYIAAKNQTMATDSTLEQIMDTVAVLGGLTVTAANHYLINKYSRSPSSENKESSMA